ncbi:penicillin-insensitive murein endopeptidase [Falsiroseomonas oryzae]|uniref:penicillin-insensitive murein endopeptidase n=1 Tax=Falsiroseomonas oryzae TaxID=2766473 RepID=UPI0022EA749C|nr:penicillin-insensitive murein endopeptidase [Roseomonas sp. MO-31]
MLRPAPWRLATALAALVALPAAAVEAPLARASDWAALSRPSQGPARAIGGTGLGCLAGGVALPAEGPGWQAVRVSRNRHWGHPAAIALVEHVSGRARAAGFPDLWIGDIAQPRGGPMPWGHASHQTGLDVDIWLDLRPKPRVPAAQREDLTIPSLVLPDESGVDPARWTPRHAQLIRIATEAPGVDRVLVNHAIKRRLCADHRGEAWLRRVRPWRGHDSHMHIRLRCPEDSPECRDIAPPPPGDGCDASLDWWLTPDARRRPVPGPPGPPPRLPLACAAVLRAPDLPTR